MKDRERQRGKRDIEKEIVRHRGNIERNRTIQNLQIFIIYQSEKSDRNIETERVKGRVKEIETDG